MANENDKINFKGMTIVPSLSLNKHVSAVHNYSLLDAINMRMSNDRTHLQNIEDVVANETINNGIKAVISNYSVVDICSCKNELVIFVLNNDIYTNKKMTIFRYDEKNNIIYRAYNGYFSYYNGKLSFDYTYNVNGHLILAFCEYDTRDNVKVPLKTINLNEQLYSNADIDLDEDKLSIKPGIKLSNFTDVYYQSGAGYTGWHYIYIQYKINEGRYTEWYRIGFPIKLLEEIHNTLFTNYCINPKTGVNDVKHSGLYILNTGYINKTYSFEFTLDESFYQYRIGVIVANNTNRKQFVTEFINCNSNKSTFIFNVNQLKEESFNIEQRVNFYNVKNILNYKNELYISNYESFDFGNINVENINLNLTTIDKSDIITPEIIIDKITSGNATVYQGVYNFDRNILWLLLSIHEKRSYINILNSLNNVQNNLIYIRKHAYLQTGVSSRSNIEYCCRIEDIYYEYKAITINNIPGEDPRDYYYIILKGKDINGNDIKITPFWNNEEYSIIGYNAITGNTNVGLIQIRTASGDTDNDIICCYGSSISDTVNSNTRWAVFVFCKYAKMSTNINFDDYVDILNFDIWNDNDMYKIIKANDWYPIRSFNELYTLHPSYFTIVTHQSYTEQKQYYLTTLPPNEIFDFYIHFINKYGEISDGYRLNNNSAFIYINDVPYVCIKNQSDYYLTPANIQIKYIDLLINPIYKVDENSPTTIIDTYTTINACPIFLQDYLQNIEFKDFYFNTLANWNFSNKFIPYYNGYVTLFKTFTSPSIDSDVIACSINGVVLPTESIGYFISYNKIEFCTNNIGIRLNNAAYMQYYSVLNDILDYKTFNNFYSDIPLTPSIKPFSGNLIDKTVPYNFNPIYNKIFDLEIGYAGENKFGRRGKSSILSQASALGSPTMAFVNADANTIGYITELFNLNNNFYLNEPTLFKFSNYFYEVNNNQIIDGNLLGEYYDLLNIIYNELGVVYYYKADPDESDTDRIQMDIETLDSIKYNDQSIVNIPVALVNIKNISLHSFNIETKNNPFQIGNKIFISPINTLNYFNQFIKEQWEYDEYVFQKYDENKKHTIFNNTILFSNVINDESSEIKWNEFLAESYKFISENKGEIINMFTLGNNIFIHCLNALYVLQFKDYLATTEESLQITQSTIKDISYKELLPTDKGFCGLQDKEAAIVGNFGYIFYENDTNRLLRFDNNQLIYIDYPILQWLKKYKPKKVRFANDVERNILIIKLEYFLSSFVSDEIMLIYDYEINAFISRFYGYDFRKAFNTKNKLYFVHDYSPSIDIISDTNKKQTEYIINIIKLDNNTIETRKITNKLSFIFNDEYNVIKFIENIEWNVYKFTKSLTYKFDTNEPIEHHRFIYPGDYIRIYNDLVDTGWIDIKETNTNGATNQYNNKDITKPYYRLGKYIMNLFRNVKDVIVANYDREPTQKTYSSADDRSRLYGKWFIIEFGFNTKDNVDANSTIEFENIKLNVSQQTQNI